MPEALIALLFFLVLVAVARTSRPATDQQGQAISPPAQWPAEPKTLKVATFNIQAGKSLQGKRDISKSAAVISGADIVGVQEVHAESWPDKLGFGLPQINALAAEGQFGHLYGAARRRWFRDHRGNALLSKLPISAWRVVMLPDQTGKRYRNMMIADFTWQGVPVTLINTHLHTQDGREQQLDRALAEFAKYPRVILLGDLNSTRETASLARALKDQSIVDAIATAGLSLNDPERIDWILTRGFKVMDGKKLEPGVSDHPYYQVTLALDSR